VIIGQHLDKEKVTRELEDCLCNEAEIDYFQRGGKFQDHWPI